MLCAKAMRDRQQRGQIEAESDVSSAGMLYTRTFVARHEHCLRGALIAALRPLRLTDVITSCALSDRLAALVLDKLIANRELPGFCLLL